MDAAMIDHILSEFWRGGEARPSASLDTARRAAQSVSKTWFVSEGAGDEQGCRAMVEVIDERCESCGHQSRKAYHGSGPDPAIALAMAAAAAYRARHGVLS
jgi:hypothetical protein